MYKITSLLLLLLSFSVHADIYKFYDENGNVVFTDHPEVGAEKIKEKSLQTISSPKPAVSSSSTPAGVTKKKKEPTAYKVAITSPKNDTAIRANDGVINVDVSITPELDTKRGHKLALSLDGKTVGEPGTSTAFTLDGLDRGTHSIAANILDKKGNAVASAASITVHIKRISILHPIPKANRPDRVPPF